MSALTRVLKDHKLLRVPDTEERSVKLDDVNKGTMGAPGIFATEKGLGSESL